MRMRGEDGRDEMDERGTSLQEREGWRRSDGADRVSGRHTEGETDGAETTVDGKEGGRQNRRAVVRGGGDGEMDAESWLRTDR